MLENLSLDLTNKQIQSKMTSSTTNASDETLAYLISGGGTTDNQFAEEGIANWSSSNSYDSYSRPLAYTYLKDTTVDITSIFLPSYNERVGVYYNYCAASAGSYCYRYDTLLHKAVDGTESEITEDICPKGWELPTENEFSEFLNLKSPDHQNVSYKQDTSAFMNAFHTSEKIGSCRYQYDYDEEEYFENNIKKLYIDSGTTKYWSSTSGPSSVGSTLVYTLDIGLYNTPEIIQTSSSDGFTIRCLHK